MTSSLVLVVCHPPAVNAQLNTDLYLLHTIERATRWFGTTRLEQRVGGLGVDITPLVDTAHSCMHAHMHQHKRQNLTLRMYVCAHIDLWTGYTAYLYTQVDRLPRWTTGMPQRLSQGREPPH